MNSLAFPIFVAEGLDIRIFDSVEDAERSLEPWWVEEGLGKIYDAQGRSLGLKVSNKRVSIFLKEEDPTSTDELIETNRGQTTVTK